MENKQARGLIKGLENWAKSVTSGYRDVNVSDMSASFRDGLAFCAIIHHYRPDLIDFNSLSKENIQENNSLAFSTAEKQLGVPALLDAEDMVKYSRPDRLSIITYLSQLHNCFLNQNRVNASKGKVKIRANSDEGPPIKVPSLLTNKRHEMCHTCNHRVFILERLMVDGKLYHTTCFRCNKCDNLLNPGAYVESDTPGLYECAVCLSDEGSHSTAQQNTASPAQSPMPKRQTSPLAPSPVGNARNSLLEKCVEKESSPLLMKKSPFLRSDSKAKSPSSWRSSMPSSFESGDAKVVSPDGGVSVKDKISVFETHRISKLDSSSPDNDVAKKTATAELPVKSIISSPSSERPSSVNSTTTLPKSPLNSPLLKPAEITIRSFPSKTVENFPDSQNVQQNCESTSDSAPNLVPSPKQMSVPSPQTRYSLQLTKETEKPKESSRILEGDYKSPFKSRDIFQTNIQPLKLSIPTIRSTTRDYGKSSETSILTPSYPTTLPRQGSIGSFSGNQTIPRRSSLESQSHNSGFPNTPSADSLQKEESKSLTEMNLENALSILTGVDEKSEERSEVPVPKVRHSLETKRQLIISETDGTKPLVVSSKETKSLNEPCETISVKPPPKEAEEDSSEIQYPDDLNPFGDDERAEIEYPDDLNPFGDDAPKEPKVTPPQATDDYDESKNPFASDSEEDVPVKSQPTTPRSPVILNGSSPTGSLQGTMKKRPAPKPPRMSDIFPDDRKSLHTPSPKARRSKPAAPPPPVPADLAASTKQLKESDNLKTKREAPKKKRPAPPVPIPKRVETNKIPLKEIVREMKEIEEKQRECERQGRELELLIRDRDKDEEPSIEEEEYIMQLFELVNQKNALFRRQAELMYIKRFQRLEEQQAELQEQIRKLLMIPNEEKTEEDLLKEEMLILEHRDIVDQRNSIIDSIEMDRRRELEEDASVQEQIEAKNGDLPITAELKEKSSGKEKKFKLKRDKKEKKEKKEKKKKK